MLNKSLIILGISIFTYNRYRFNNFMKFKKLDNLSFKELYIKSDKKYIYKEYNYYKFNNSILKILSNNDTNYLMYMMYNNIIMKKSKIIKSENIYYDNNQTKLLDDIHIYPRYVIYKYKKNNEIIITKVIPSSEKYYGLYINNNLYALFSTKRQLKKYIFYKYSKFSNIYIFIIICLFFNFLLNNMSYEYIDEYINNKFLYDMLYN